MFNKFGFIICCSALLMQACNLFSEIPSTNKTSVKWQTNFEEAKKQAETAAKPMVLLFTGSDWCSWCTKLEDEALSTPEFAANAGNKFIFVKVDFPLYTNQDPQIKAQNKNLQQKFNIRSFPTVVLYDPAKNQTIGSSGYRPGGGKSYSDYLLKLLYDYSSYKQKVSMLDKANYSGQELKSLYEQAKKLNLENDSHLILAQGVKSDKSLFFSTERYRQLVDEGEIASSEATTLRQQLIAADPHNEKLVPYQIAIMEYEAILERSSEKTKPEQIVAPLNNYIEKFGNTDKENLWRLQIIISQVYLDDNQMPEALKYAQLSYDSAPPAAQPEIARAIQNIRSLINSASMITTRI